MSDIDFSLRPNKSIERKLMLECFIALTTKFDLSIYTYIGFGSFWFVDFLLFHKKLGITTLKSIEREKFAKRAEFNAPLKCIDVFSGDSTLVLPSLVTGTNEIYWLDYDGGIDCSWIDDAQIVLDKLHAGSIYCVTVNASPGVIKGCENEYGEELSRLEALTTLIGDLVPVGTTNSELSWKRMPNTVGRILINHFKRVVRRANPDLEFLPIFNFFYKDNAPMVTVGGIVADQNTKEDLVRCNLSKFSFLNGEEQVTISAPALTLREKQAIDCKLPKGVSLREDEIPMKLRKGLGIKAINGYQDFYRYYPIFAELFD